MLKTFFTLFIVAAALLSLIILITFRTLDNLMLLTSIIFNIIWLTTIFYIQPIGLDIKIFTLYFLLFNNIILSIVRLIYNNLSVESKIKELLGIILTNYMQILFIYPNYLLRKLFTSGNQILDIFNNRINNILYDLLVIEPLKLINKEFNEISKSNILTFENNKLLDHKHLFKALFAALELEPEFKKEGQKIMIVSISKEDKTFFIHKNIIIDENTTINIYLDKIKNSIQSFYESGYPLTTFNILEVKLWDLNNKTTGKRGITSNSIHQSRRSFHTSCINLANKDLNLIKPLKIPKNINKLLIATIDLETIEINNVQIPISISFSYLLHGRINTIFQLIDYKLLLMNQDEAVKLLWFNFMNEINELKLHKVVVFSHNLGSFDGYFIFKGLLGLPGIDINKVNSIIDELHRFIGIDITYKDSKIIFKDSLRIFPVSLQELCKIFEVEGKLQSYNPLFNKITMFKDENLLNSFINYSKQDSICLLKALVKAQGIYIEEHKVDIATIWSTSTLSFKIFRQKFLNCNIPTLTKNMDSIIRLGYIGGSTDYLYKYGENLKYYDVNSLYPKAMCNPMPMEYLGESLGSDVSLENVFGFAEAKITAPDNIEIPLLPFKIYNETLHPLGSWIGIYFTEELKTVKKYGYKVELIKVYNFSKADIFSSYIKYFYNIKKVATGPLRLIAKMHLNQLYGYFGRRKTLIETKNVYTKDLINYYGSNTIFSQIRINNEISTILMSSNLDFNVINEIKNETKLDLLTNFRVIKSNVAIAAAVTAYARMEMAELKMLLINLGFKIYYTDTDSLFVDKELPEYLIGNELGQLKDELGGGRIKKAYFLGIKKYGYIDSNNITHSIFSGVSRNSLNWNEIEQISQDNQEVIIQQDDSKNIIDTWDKVEVKYLGKNNLNILFGRMAKDSKSILINTTDNQEINYDLKFNIVNNYTNENFNWKSNFIGSNIEINKIWIRDLNGFNHLIYSNEDEH